MANWGANHPMIVAWALFGMSALNGVTGGWNLMWFTHDHMVVHIFLFGLCFYCSVVAFLRFIWWRRMAIRIRNLGEM